MKYTKEREKSLQLKTTTKGPSLKKTTLNHNKGGREWLPTESQTVATKCSKLARGTSDGNLLFFGAVMAVTRFRERQHVQLQAVGKVRMRMNCLLSFWLPALKKLLHTRPLYRAQLPNDWAIRELYSWISLIRKMCCRKHAGTSQEENEINNAGQRVLCCFQVERK